MEFSDLRVQGCETPINTGLAPCFGGCQGCHKGVMGDPPQTSLHREGALSLGLGLSLSFRNSLAYIIHSA